MKKLSEEEIELFHSTIRPYAPVTGRSAASNGDEEESLLLKFCYVGIQRHSQRSVLSPKHKDEDHLIRNGIGDEDSTSPSKNKEELPEFEEEDVNRSRIQDFEDALWTLFDISREQIEPVKYENVKKKWISQSSFNVDDCTLPLNLQANILSPGGTGARLETYKHRKVSVEQRKGGEVCWGDAYVSSAVVQTAIAEPFCEEEMKLVSVILRTVLCSTVAVFPLFMSNKSSLAPPSNPGVWNTVGRARQKQVRVPTSKSYISMDR